jgi:hypothetical protein
MRAITRPTGSVALDALLAGGRLDEIGAGHHADEAGARDVRERGQLADTEDGLEVRGPARVAEGAHLVVERGPVAGEHVRARDHHVDLRGAGIDARVISASRCSKRTDPPGNPPDTAATGMPLPLSASTAVATNGDTRTPRPPSAEILGDAERVSAGPAHRWRALAQRRARCRGVVARERGEVHAA